MVVNKNGYLCSKTNQIYLEIMLGKLLKSYLKNPLVLNQKIGLPETTILHSRIIQENRFLKQIYEDWYNSILTLLPQNISGPILELGTGGGFLKKYIPNLITSEILKIPNIDIILDGQNLPFTNECLKGIVMTNVFHHIPRVNSFLKDAAYSVKPGGVIIMIEPWVTPWARLIYKHLHHEPFNQIAKEWKLPEGELGVRANMALPWIIFKRDRRKFEKKFPEWEIKNIKSHMPFRYLLSGGVSYKNFLPGNLYKMSREIEHMLLPWMKYLAMFSTIILLRK